MKKIISMGLAVSLVSSLFAYDYEIKEGWQQIGAVSDIADLSVFDNTCVDSVLRYDNEIVSSAQKKIYLPNNTTYPNYGIELSSLNKGDGFEVIANGSCTVSVPDPVEVGGISFKGLTYGTVVSPFTGKEWLDRNLGAFRVCETFNDAGCYGDYYQWGRLADGHEKTYSGQTTTFPPDVSNVGHSNSIYGQATSSGRWSYDDTNGAIREAQWAKIDGTGICPIGFRAPSYDELKAETTEASIPVTNPTTAFENFLKIPASGYLTGWTTMTHVNEHSYLWPGTPTGGASWSFGTLNALYRSNSAPVRCIKD